MSDVLIVAVLLTLGAAFVAAVIRADARAERAAERQRQRIISGAVWSLCDAVHRNQQQQGGDPR